MLRIRVLRRTAATAISVSTGGDEVTIGMRVHTFRL
jgi:hypothetical protein